MVIARVDAYYNGTFFLPRLSLILRIVEMAVPAPSSMVASGEGHCLKRRGNYYPVGLSAG
ncbi:MAG: hypothetical protein ACOX6X_06270 [Dethiobacteria bacterium]|jgi:hypothetical protein